ncbi:MAG: hypothetical protein MJA27_02205, partial [Pseudanabaenales cyanobacterium]|nr:hypothetical protein [Pseudanabaenales cyanobacterium]
AYNLSRENLTPKSAAAFVGSNHFPVRLPALKYTPAAPHNNPNAHRPLRSYLLSVRGYLRRAIGTVIPLHCPCFFRSLYIPS